MDERDDVNGCVVEFIKQGFRLFVPAASLMAIAAFSGIFGQKMTGSDLVGLFLFVTVPTAILILFLNGNN